MLSQSVLQRCPQLSTSQLPPRQLAPRRLQPCSSPSVSCQARTPASENNPSTGGDSGASTPGRRRRATTRRTTKAVEPEASERPITSTSGHSTSSTTTGHRPAAGALQQHDSPADPLQEKQSASKQPKQPSSPAEHSLKSAATQTEAGGVPKKPAAPKPRRQRPSSPVQPDQQAEPPQICYNLSSAVGSYSDFNRCSVHLDEDDHSRNGDSSASDSSRRASSSKASGSRANSQLSNRSHSRAGNGTGTHGSDRSADDVRGLVYGATVRFSDSAALRLRRRAMVVWEEDGPRKVLIVKKPVPAAATTLREMATWLQRRGLQVFVERSVQQTECPDLQAFDPSVTQVDFAITLGGDGTVLHLASLFAEDTPLPPVMCFAMGTLGFLTPFDAAQFRSCLARVLAANRKPLYCTLRTRKRCAVLDGDGQLKRVHHILNECVVDRGAFPSSVYLELFIDGSFVTAAEADGLIIATPSGSTAYSMSAGGSMVAPSVPCTLVTPLSPHSLSFRPLIIPENADLMVRLPENARAHARASFDGKHPMRIAKGYSVHFETSLCPLPLINIGVLDVDWYEGITRKLKWNQSIRGVAGTTSGGLETAILQKAAAAASGIHAAELQPQLSLGGLVSDLTAAAHNEAKVASWVEEALLEDVSRDSRDPSLIKGGNGAAVAARQHSHSP